MFAARGSGEVLNQNGEPVRFLVKPWLDPRHQEQIASPVGGTLEFTGGDARYRMSYSVHIKNPWYVGPYQP
jgi:hypothetical protein